MSTLSATDISIFMELFDREGYVLDFSDKSFNDFTGKVIGIPVKIKYENEGLSKGKSLRKFCNEEDDGLVKKLLLELMKYYEVHFQNKDESCFDALTYKNYYKHCKELSETWEITNNSFMKSAEYLKESFSSEYLTRQINLMMKMQNENPTEAIGKAKELIESCCKTILAENSIVYDKNWNMNELTKETFKQLKLLPEDISDNMPAATEIKGILGNLKTIAGNIATLRNIYGSGHGKESTYKGLQPRHAKLAVGSCITLVEFLWDSHTRKLNCK